MYEIKLHSEFIGTIEYWYFQVSSGEYTVLVPSSGTSARETTEDLKMHTLADRIGRFMDEMEP